MVRSSSALEYSQETDPEGWIKHTLPYLIGQASKRAFDFISAFIGLLCLSPLFLLIAILIKRDSPGPVFYRALRTGWNGKIFRMLKFRTMYQEEENHPGSCITCKGDDRVTPLGKWLRDTKLNELPQLWNVLAGEMSLVGPRPEDPALERAWPDKIAREILQVRPGITSPASVLYRNEESMLVAGDVLQKYLHELAPDKMRLDQLYVRYRSFWLDLDVILWTILLLIPRIKSYSPPESFLFAGPVTRLIQRYVSWFLWDFLIVLTSLGFTGALVRLFGPLDIGWSRAILMALRLSAACSLLGILLNINLINWSKATIWSSGRLGLSWTAATMATLAFHHFYLQVGLRPFMVILGASMLSLAGVIFIRYRRRIISWLLVHIHSTRQRALRERVLIVGSGRTAEHIASLMDHPAYSTKFKVVGYIDDDLFTQGMEIYGSKVIGRVGDIEKVARERDIGLIVLADSCLTSQEQRMLHDVARFNPAKIVAVPDVFGSLNSLGLAAPKDETGDNLDDFNCQHCVARHRAYQDRMQPASPKQVRRKSQVSREHALQNKKKWRAPGRI
jgi:lipopolysaccharide/colanic/teichoic acid biosynthesis glycosyltransferase